MTRAGGVSWRAHTLGPLKPSSSPDKENPIVNHTKNELKSWSASVFDFRILMSDGSIVETRNTLAQVLRWEDNRDERWGSKPLGAKGLLYLAWLAGRNDGTITEPVFDRWVVDVVDLDTEPVKRRDDGSTDELDNVEGAPGIADFTEPDQSGGY